MVPTLLTDVKRLRIALAKLEADIGLPEAVRSDLATLGSLVRLIELSSAAGAAHLSAEIRHLRSALGPISELADEPLAGEIRSLLSEVPDWGELPTGEHSGLHRESWRLRELMSRVIHESSAGLESATSAKILALAAAGLRAGLETLPW